MAIYPRSGTLGSDIVNAEVMAEKFAAAPLKIGFGNFFFKTTPLCVCGYLSAADLTSHHDVLSSPFTVALFIQISSFL